MQTVSFHSVESASEIIDTAMRTPHPPDDPFIDYLAFQWIRGGVLFSASRPAVDVMIGGVQAAMRTDYQPIADWAVQLGYQETRLPDLDLYFCASSGDEGTWLACVHRSRCPDVWIGTSSETIIRRLVVASIGGALHELPKPRARRRFPETMLPAAGRWSASLPAPVASGWGLASVLAFCPN